MGKTKDKTHKIKKTLAHLVKMEENFKYRHEEILKDIKKTLEIKDKKIRLFKLERINDELNGYCARIEHSNKSAQNIYESHVPKTKSLKDLEDGIRRRFYNDNQHDHVKKLKTNRDKGCHPDPYFVSDVILDAENNHDLIKNSIAQLNSLNLTDQLNCKRERINQEIDTENKFIKIAEISKEDERAALSNLVVLLK